MCILLYPFYCIFTHFLSYGIHAKQKHVLQLLLEQRIVTQSLKYWEYKNGASGAACSPAIPCMGIMPSHMPSHLFSKNYVDIESALFGINSTNLVEPQQTVVPQLTTLPEISFFGRMQLVMPDPLIIEKFQRPFPVPN